MHKPFIIIGAGGHAKVVADLLLEAGHTLLGFTDQNAFRAGEKMFGVEILGNDDILKSYQPDEINLAMGLGVSPTNYINSLEQRLNLHQALMKSGYSFPPLVHSSAYIGRECVLADGVQVMTGCLIQPGTTVGAFSIINTGASIDHDCKIMQGTHIGPKVSIGGNVSIGETSYIGIGATVIQSMEIGTKSIVGAGSVVVNDVIPKSRVMGVPAKAV